MKPIIHILFLCLSCRSFAAGQSVVVGAERIDAYLPMLEGCRVGLVVNHTARVGETHLVDTLCASGVDIRLIFSPEHGFRGQAEAGEEVVDHHDARTGIPLISLYGKKKKPSVEDLAEIDLVIFDIQDVGARFYTYISTLFYVAEACAEQGKKLMVLDRPNPNGHYIDGPVLEPPYRSFVGIAPLPIVHGCTVGELALMYQGEKWIHKAENLDLFVVTCMGYCHSDRYELPVPPSPNLPDMRSIWLYPSICLFEGAKLSVGRGTPTPFQRFGYPDFPAGDISFVPCPNEGAQTPPYAGSFCQGYDLSACDADLIYEYGRIDLSWLLYFYRNSPRKDDFFLPNGYFNLLAGTATLRIQIEQGDSEAAIRAGWEKALKAYKEMREKYLLYE